jgi:cytochrome c553
VSPTWVRLAKKIAIISVEVVAAIAVTAVVAIYAISQWQLSTRHDVGQHPLRVKPVAMMAAEGAHLAHTHGCTGCHAEGLTGHLFVEQLFIGRLAGPNLTRIVPHYSDQQIADLIRSGVRPDGTGVVFMPSHALVRLADDDVAAIIAYLRTLKTHPDTAKDSSFGLLARALIVAGEIPLEPNMVDRAQLGPLHRPTGAGALGPYLARTTCAMCHGSDLHGEEQTQSPNLFEMVPAYSPDQFRTLLTTGIAPGGRKLGLMTEMSVAGLKYLRDDEVTALYAYLSAGEHGASPQ